MSTATTVGGEEGQHGQVRKEERQLREEARRAASTVGEGGGSG